MNRLRVILIAIAPLALCVGAPRVFGALLGLGYCFMLSGLLGALSLVHLIGGIS